MFERKTTIDKLIENQNKEIDKNKQKLENLKLACKEVARDVNGKFLLKFLKETCLWCQQDMNINHDSIVYKKGRNDVWLIFRTILPKDVLAQIEVYDEDKLED